jgi:hypothetical protein
MSIQNTRIRSWIGVNIGGAQAWILAYNLVRNTPHVRMVVAFAVSTRERETRFSSLCCKKGPE